MNGLQNFQGDILLYETVDGGEVAVENGLFIADKQFSTAVYISLFGGNKTDAGKVNNKNQFWGNVLSGVSESEKLRSRFQFILMGLPMSVKNIREAEAAAVLDLKWLIDEKIADDVTAYGQAVGKNRFNLTVNILKDKSTIFESVYSLLWGVGYGESV
jgi:phage gp46-like protein